MYKILLKKDITEILKTYKLFVVPAIFLFFGFTSPITAKFMPEFIKSMADSGFKFELPTPTWIDAFEQFFKNLNQIGMLAIILTTMGTIAEEKSKGIIHLILSRSVRRWNIILSKFTASALLLAFSLFLGFIACGYGTFILFNDILFQDVLFATFLYFVYALFILSLTVFASAITRSTTVAAAISIGGFLFFSILSSIHPTLAKYSPGGLTNSIHLAITHSLDYENVIVTLSISIGLSFLFLLAGNYVFSKQEI